jgi:hypothetical protein
LERDLTGEVPRPGRDPWITRRRFVVSTALAGYALARARPVPALAGVSGHPLDLQVVGTRSGNTSSSTCSNGTNTGSNSHRRIVFPNGARRVGLLYANFIVNPAHGGDLGSYDNRLPNPITVSASMGPTTVGVSPTPARPSVYFGYDTSTARSLDGTQLSVSLAPADFVVFDTGMSVEPGGAMFVNTYATVPSGQVFPQLTTEVPGTSRGEAATKSVGEPDRTNVAAGGWKANATTGAYEAYAIVDLDPAATGGPRAAILAVGDSLLAGAYGFRALLSQDGRPFVSIARGSEAARTFLNFNYTTAYRRTLAHARCQGAVVQYFTNDAALEDGRQTLTAWQANDSKLFAFLRGYGIAKIGRCTIPPTTASADGWSTLSGQYLNMAHGQRGAREGTRQAYNAYLRSFPLVTTLPSAAEVRDMSSRYGAGALVFDCWKHMEVMEPDTSGHATGNGQPIGKWTVVNGPCTADGLHPGTAAGSNLQRAGLDLSYLDP